ncbi:MFS transporter [Ramlibacter sp. AW1]|uniref:MFS transporter n=1 Tax=Ramlibacter aurantiacus TaxID=2801330 RepID=A0A937D9A9_9BURK|nr:MFS transporter [Ramlibacter aurantiacus]MBL0422961.1 MFS transporter [Ramlibacter aurantiacus]
MSQPPAPSTLSPLQHPAFRLLLVTSLAANTGNAIQVVGAAWLMASLDGRAAMVGLVQTAVALPMMLLAIVAGAVADVYDRRAVMRLALAGTAGVSGALALLTLLGLTTPWLLVGLTFAVGLGFAFYSPAAQATLPRVVPRHELAGAATLNILGFNVARTAGPALGGLMVAAGGPVASFAGNALACAVGLLVIGLWRPQEPAPAHQRPPRAIARALAEGLRCVRDSGPLRTTVTRAAAFMLAGTAAWALMPLVARDLVGGGARQFGYLLGAMGLGAVVGALASAQVRKRLSSEHIIRWAGVVYGLACLVVAARPGFAASFVALTIGGAAWVQALAGFNVAGQLWAPPGLVGRVTATVSTAIYAGMSIGAWAWGHVAEAFGIGACIAASGAAMVAMAGLGLLLPLPRHEDAPAH